jgi:hypothetical protein
MSLEHSPARQGRPRGKLSKKELEALRARQEAQREASTQYENDNQVLTFKQWCRLNNFSTATGKRILNSKNHPPVIWFSERRKGIRVRDDRLWKEGLAQAS